MQIDNGIFLIPLPENHEDQRGCGDYREQHNEMRFEPVIALAFVKDDLQSSQAQSHKAQADVIDFSLAEFAAAEVRRVLDQSRSEKDGNDTDGNVDEKNPAQGEVVGDPASQSWPDGRRGYDSDAVNGKSHAPFGRRKRIREDRLLAGLQSASACTLQHAANNENGEIRRQSTQERADRKESHAAHVKILAAYDGGKPAAQREHDSVRDEVGSENPGAFVLPCGKTTRDMGERYVGNRSVKHLHESRQRNCDSDNPWIDGWTPSIRLANRSGPSAHCRIQTLGSTDMPGRND